MRVKDIVHFLFEVGTMRKLPRSHMQTLMTSDLSDNIASHSYRVTMIGWHLAMMEKADVNKVVKMCLLHDLGESRSGDQNWVHKKYVKTFENEILEDQFLKYPEMQALAKEYDQRKTKESKIAKDADLLDQELLLKEYEWQGNKEASVWLAGYEQRNRLSTKSALKISKEIRKQTPHDWWQNIWTAKRR